MIPYDEYTEFNGRMIAAVEAATAEVVESGRATLTQEFEEGPGDYLLLRPTNPKACEVTILIDGYPTVSFDGATCEMFGDDDERIECLIEYMADAIAGRFVWGRRQEKNLWGLFGSTTILYGDFLGIPESEFTRGGGEPPGAVEHHTFEPY